MKLTGDLMPKSALRTRVNGNLTLYTSKLSNKINELMLLGEIVIANQQFAGRPLNK